MAKLHAAKCPTCGADLRVDPNAPNVLCRFCQNLIVIEKRAPPPDVAALLGALGGVPSAQAHASQVHISSRTLYIDPKTIRTTRAVVWGFAALMAVPVLLPIGALVIWPLLQTVKGSVRPFPATCGLNETLTLSGDFNGPGPAITSVGHNCKVTIKKSKIKAASLVDTSAVNFELTITDSTIDTTGPLLRVGTNTKLHVKGGSLKSDGQVVVTKGHNLEIRLEGATLESRGDTAIKSSSVNLEAKNATVRGKKSALDIDGHAEIDAEGTTFEAQGPTLVFDAAKIELTGGSVTSKTDRAIKGDNGVGLTVSGTKVQGATDAVSVTSNFRLEATDKASFLAGTGHGLAVAGSNGNLTLMDATVDAGRAAVEGDVNLTIELGPGARLSGKKGGVSSPGNFKLDANGATIDGGAGAGLEVRGGAEISMLNGALKGNPALSIPRRPAKLELGGTQITGASSVP